MKQEKEKTWISPTNRTIYQWTEASKTKEGELPYVPNDLMDT
jgi:hypothetical protein